MKIHLQAKIIMLLFMVSMARKCKIGEKNCKVSCVFSEIYEMALCNYLKGVLCDKDVINICQYATSASKSMFNILSASSITYKIHTMEVMSKSSIYIRVTKDFRWLLLLTKGHQQIGQENN